MSPLGGQPKQSCYIPVTVENCEDTMYIANYDGESRNQEERTNMLCDWSAK